VNYLLVSLITHGDICMKKTLLIIATSVLPVVSFAAAGELTVFKNLANSIANIVGILIPLAFMLAVLAFFWGIVVFIFAEQDKAKEKAKGRMLWSIIAMFVMASVWGLVGFLGDIFGVGQGGQAAVPGVGNSNVAPDMRL
jgi:undecaprenyl pyrophosphate phosphatase UppP